MDTVRPFAPGGPIPIEGMQKLAERYGGDYAKVDERVKACTRLIGKCPNVR